MNREEVTQAISELIENFQNLPRDEKLTFLTFNQYHHKRSINEVVSIYVQNPEARLLGSFDYWKNLSTESSVAFGQKASVRIWNEYGRVKETLYDVSQTTLREGLHLPDTIIEERVLVNTLAELVNGEYLLGDFQQQEFNVFASQYITEYIDKTVPNLPNYTETQKALALSIAKFNIFEEFGAFLEDDNDYQAFVQTILNDFDKLPADESLLRTFALANNFSQEFSRQILSNYERVAELTKERLEKQEQLHQKLEQLEPHISFESSPTHETTVTRALPVGTVTETTLSGITNPHSIDEEAQARAKRGTLKEVVSSEDYSLAMVEAYQYLYDSYMIKKDLPQLFDIHDEFDVKGAKKNESIRFFYNAEEVGTTRERRVVFGVVIGNQSLQTPPMSTPIRSRVYNAFEKGSQALNLTNKRLEKSEEVDESTSFAELPVQSKPVLDRVEFLTQLKERLIPEKYWDKFPIGTLPEHPELTENDAVLTIYDLNGVPNTIASMDLEGHLDTFDGIDKLIESQTGITDFKSQLIVKAFTLRDEFAKEKGLPLPEDPYKVTSLQKKEELLEVTQANSNLSEAPTPTQKSSVAEVEWNESSSTEIFEFINRSHEHAPINRSVLEAMIRDEIKLEELNETGYYKVETTLGRIYLGDGFESNKQLYQALSDDNELNIDVQAYYDSIAPEKVQQLSIKEVLQQVRDKMNLPESFKVKSIGSGDFAIMKETLGGILNEPIVDWYQDGGVEVKENAPKLTENPFFEKEFNLYLGEVLEDFKTSIQKETILTNPEVEKDKSVENYSEELSEDSTIISENEPSDKELLQEVFKRGSGFSQGKLRIQYYFSEHEFNFSKTKAAAFLKEEMGVGGHGEKLLQYSYDSQGLKVKMPVDRNFSWAKAVDYLSETVFSGQYLTPTEQLDYQTWKSEPKNIDYAKARWQEPLPTPEKEVQNEISLFDFDEGFAETVIPESEPAFDVQSNSSNIEKLAGHVDEDKSDEVLIQSDLERATPIREPLLDYSFPSDSIYSQKTADKVKDNIQALQLLKELNTDKRNATENEQEVLAKYVGWGGLANTFFDESNPRFQEERETLKSLVSSKEYGQIRKSSLTAYFTDPDIIIHLYRQISDLGFEGGRILDPSMGSGNFFSAMPQNLKEKSDLYGVELETLSGQLSKQLHQTANIQVKGFETTTFANDSMDLVMTNVPFGQTYLTDDKYEKNYAIHDYFIKKALDLVHEGGFVAVITSTYTMDKQNDSFRKELSKQANLVGAVRLPDSAFKNIAGTDVSSDILIFQKTSSPELNPVWLDTVKQSDALGNVVAYNRYFEQFPDKVLGDLKIKTFNGGTLSIQNKSSHDDLMNALDVALNFERNQNITTLERQPEVFEVAKSNDESIPVEVLENIAPFTLYVHDNRPYYHNGKNVELHQKTSSINLKTNEDRKAQLERYERNKDKIFDQKEKFVTSYVGKGYFDSWNNFIPTTSEGKNNLPDIDADTLKKIAQNNAAFSNNKRYNFDPKTSQLTIESLESTQYFYHVDYNKADVKAIEQMIDLRQTLHEVLSVQHQPNFQEEYEPLRETLNQKYDAFVAQYGAISSRNNHSLMKKDDYYQFLASIEDEVEDEKTKLPKYVKGTVFFEPTIQVEKGVVEVNSASDALLASLNHQGKLDFDYMKDIYPHTKEEMVAELGDRLFYLGANEYQVREDYLSGDVKTKLSIAQSNRDFDFEGYDWTRNISALEEVIPKDLMISEINFKLGTRFIPTSIYQKFFAEVLDQKSRGTQEPKPEFVTIEYDKEADVYHVELEITHTYAVTDKYGYKNYSKNQSYPADRLATTLLNQRAPKLYQPDPDDSTGRKRILDSDATASIQEKGVALATQFEEWVMKTPEIQAEIVKVYNERYNRSIVKVYEGQQLTVNGLATQYQLRPHQQNAVMRIIQERRAGLAHEVGSGKTLTMLAASMKLQELGVISKPMFVIPKPLVDQFAREIYKYFPESKVLVATSEDFTKEHRKRFISRIANGSYNAIVIADSQFGKVAMSREYQEYYINNELNLAREVLENSDSESKYTVKRIEKKIEGLEKRLENLQKTDTDTFINFEELGIDFLFVDEAHNYKNLAPYTQLENVKGVSDTRSQKALDLMMKVEYLHNLYDNRNVVLSTGTPMSNSVVELYTMMKYVEPDVLERYGVENFDSWVSSFGIIEDNFELTAAGTFKINRRFTKFGNVPELMKMFRESWDIQTSEMLDLPVPKAETYPHYTTATSTQAKYIDDLVTRATMIENGEVKPYEDNMLKIVGENRKLTLDMRALDDSVYSEMDSDKLNQVVDNVYQIYKDNDDKKSTQMIFSDLSVPYKYRNSQTFNSDGSINTFSAYDEIKRQLVLKGIPEHEIRFIHEATDKNKETMMREMRTGKIRVLLGSTGKAGTGLNVQDKLIAVHHLDVPWRPSDIAQRNGRIIRQGNENPLVQIHHYITKNSMDSFLWQTQEVKQNFIEQIMSGNSNAREMEELATDTPSPATFKASANGNPLQAEFMKLEMELQVLKRSRTRFYEGKVTDKNRIPEEQNRLSSFERRLVSIEKDLSNISDNKDKPFSLELSYNGEKKYFNDQDKKSDIGEFFAKRLNGSVLKFQASVDRVGTVSLGHYRGFELLHSVTTSHEGMEDLILKGNAQYSVRVDTSAPTGILTRIDNKIDEGITRDYDNTLTEIDRLKTAIQKIQAEEDAPFPKEEEYLEKMAHYNDLQESLKAERSGKVRDVSNDYEASEEMEM